MALNAARALLPPNQSEMVWAVSPSPRPDSLSRNLATSKELFASSAPDDHTNLFSTPSTSPRLAPKAMALNAARALLPPNQSEMVWAVSPSPRPDSLSRNLATS